MDWCRRRSMKDAKIVFNGFENNDCLGCAILDKIKIIIEFKKDVIINRKLIHKSKDLFILRTRLMINLRCK
jgi:hypothetical protein